jgi:hypothetical protein
MDTEATAENCWKQSLLCSPCQSNIRTQAVSWTDRVVSKFEVSQSHETVKHGHESHGTWNQESLCWQGPAAIYLSVSRTVGTMG